MTAATYQCTAACSILVLVVAVDKNDVVGLRTVTRTYPFVEGGNKLWRLRACHSRSSDEHGEKNG